MRVFVDKCLFLYAKGQIHKWLGFHLDFIHTYSHFPIFWHNFSINIRSQSDISRAYGYLRVCVRLASTDAETTATVVCMRVCMLHFK